MPLGKERVPHIDSDVVVDVEAVNNRTEVTDEHAEERNIREHYEWQQACKRETDNEEQGGHSFHVVVGESRSESRLHGIEHKAYRYQSQSGQHEVHETWIVDHAEAGDTECEQNCEQKVNEEVQRWLTGGWWEHCYYDEPETDRQEHNANNPNGFQPAERFLVNYCKGTQRESN